MNASKKWKIMKKTEELSTEKVNISIEKERKIW